MSDESLVKFLRGSNEIEGIIRDPTLEELAACLSFLDQTVVTVESLGCIQCVFAPGKPLRMNSGMDVRVGSHIAPPGGPNIPLRLAALLMAANTPNDDPWERHCTFETLHPYMDGNGRTGRMLWAWQMYRFGRNPFMRSFLHSWYYMTLEHGR